MRMSSKACPDIHATRAAIEQWSDPIIVTRASFAWAARGEDYKNDCEQKDDISKIVRSEGGLSG